MAIIYLDPINGNDTTGNGLSFSTAYKTLAQCHAVANDGDEIRVIKSNMPANASVSASWVRDNETVTLSSEITKSINQVASNWTKNPSYYNFCEADSITRPGDNRKYLVFTYVSSNPPNGAGKWAYQATDFSNYTGFQQISFLFRVEVSGAFVSGPLTGQPIYNQFEIKLCSDTQGNTPVFTFSFPPGAGVYSAWIPIVINTGSDFGTIQSIAIYSKSTFYKGGVGENCRFRLMNIIAAASPSNPNCLTHLSLIGKNLITDRRFYPVRFIDGPNILIGTGPRTNSITYSDTLTFTNAPFHGYPGTTEVSPLYILDPSRTGDFFIDTSPTESSRTFTKGLTIRGGWDDETTQNPNGYSWFTTPEIYNESASGNHAQLFLISNSAPPGRVFQLERIGIGHFIYGIKTQNSGISHTIRFDNSQFCSINSVIIASNGFSPTINIKNSNIGASSVILELNSSITSGSCSPIILRNCNFYNSTGTFIRAANCVYIEATYCDFSNCYFSGLTIPESKFKGYNVNYYIKGGFAILFISTTASQQTKEVLIDGFTTNLSSLPFRFPSSFPIRIMRYQGNSNDHRVFYGKRNTSPFELSSINPSGTIFSEFGIDRHSPSGLAWKLSPLDSIYITEENPIELPLVKIYVSNLNPITVSVWAKRDNAGINGRLILPTGQHGAPTSDIIADYNSPPNTYSQISINFTPSVVGVVLEVYFRVWGGSTYNFWVDDVTVT